MTDASHPNVNLDQRIATGMTRLNSHLDEVLDLDAGLADARLPGLHTTLTHALDDVLNLDAGLDHILQSPPTAPATRADDPVRLTASPQSGYRRPTGTYRQSVSRINPGCVVILLDRSASMTMPWGHTGATLATGAALAVNNILLEMCVTATSDGRVRHYFDVGVFGYGARVHDQGEGVESAFGGALARRALVGLPELADHPLEIRDEPSIDLMSTRTKRPVWVDPAHGYHTPMCQAIAVAGGHVLDWAAAHPNSFPPIVINISDGLATDSPYKGATLQDWINRLTSIETNDGPALFFNVFLSPTGGSEIVFPAEPTGLPFPGPDLFALSSELPQTMIDNARANSYDVLPGARGLAFNVGHSTLFEILQIGTSVAVSPL